MKSVRCGMLSAKLSVHARGNRLLGVLRWCSWPTWAPTGAAVEWVMAGQGECGRASDTFAHLQLVCTLEHRRALRQQAHNRIASLVERYANKI